MNKLKSIFTKQLLRQFISFLFISGIGWLVDFTVYYCLTTFFGFSVTPANFISAIPAVLWVFCFSVKRIFANNKTGLKLYQKCIIYFIYQFILAASISLFAGYLYSVFMSSELILHAFLYDNIKVIIKLLITPITMTLNFIVMRTLIEKL